MNDLLQAIEEGVVPNYPIETKTSFSAFSFSKGRILPVKTSPFSVTDLTPFVTLALLVTFTFTFLPLKTR